MVKFNIQIIVAYSSFTLKQKLIFFKITFTFYYYHNIKPIRIHNIVSMDNIHMKLHNGFTTNNYMPTFVPSVVQYLTQHIFFNLSGLYWGLFYLVVGYEPGPSLSYLTFIVYEGINENL